MVTKTRRQEGWGSLVPYLISLLLLGASISLALLLGSVNIWGSASADELFATIFWQIRLPRLAVAGLCGAAQALAGALCQGLFRNSLASPSVLGTAQGAVLAGVLAFYGAGSSMHWYSLPMIASSGALLTTLLILVCMHQGLVPSLTHLLVFGLALSSLLAALTSLVLSLALADYSKAMTMLYWLMGGFAGSSWPQLQAIAIPLALGTLMALFLAKPLNVFVLGDEVACSLGVGGKELTWWSVVASSLLVGGSVCVGGGLPFVSLLVPHLVRIFVGGEHFRLFVLSALNGMSLAIAADLLARTVVAPGEIEVGIFTAILGTPFFIYVLWRQQFSHAIRS